jgi:hypothetical protein
VEPLTGFQREGPLPNKPSLIGGGVAEVHPRRRVSPEERLTNGVYLRRGNDPPREFCLRRGRGL